MHPTVPTQPPYTIITTAQLQHLQATRALGGTGGRGRHEVGVCMLRRKMHACESAARGGERAHTLSLRARAVKVRRAVGTIRSVCT